MVAGLDAALLMFGLGGVSGLMLGLASKLFYVWEDPRISEIARSLGGANCGGCGFAGCNAAAAAIVEGRAPVTTCVVGGYEVAQKVANMLGQEVACAEPLLWESTCYGGRRATERFYYNGMKDCLAAHLLYAGSRACAVGCVGLGNCVRKCQFGALKMGPEGIPQINATLCTGCGACKRACPKGIIAVHTPSERLLHMHQQTDRLSPCRQTCPAQINIPKYIWHIKHREYKEAYLTIIDRNPFPLSVGRVCPHMCENACRRTAAGDFPVSINQLKRFCADWVLNHNLSIKIPVAPSSGHRVAVIGGGPAGLSVAYFLRRLGHQVRIFEWMTQIGGMIYHDIPEYRLPREILQKDIERILSLGIEVKTGVKFGVDFDLESLIGGGFDAVVMTIGAWGNVSAKIPDEDKIKGVYPATEFLRRHAHSEPTAIGKRVGVLGGGNVAMDAVRTAIRLGAEKVYCLYRREIKDMPANEIEIVAASAEGVDFIPLCTPKRFLTDSEGMLTGIEYVKNALGEPDSGGRQSPVPIPGSETILELDTFLTAIGQTTDSNFVKQEWRVASKLRTRQGSISGKQDTHQTALPYVFACGDCAGPPGILVSAIGTARRTARSVHKYLKGEDMTLPESTLLVNPNLMEGHIPGTIFKSLEGVSLKARCGQPELPAGSDERQMSFAEVDLTITEEAALKEADRCLSCCLTCYDKDKC